MYAEITLPHLPALVAGCGMAFGSLMPFFNPRKAMLAFGLPPRVADSPDGAARSLVFPLYAVRNTALGSLVLYFYFRGKFDVVDTILAFTGFFTGVVDGYVVWKAGSRKKAASRLAYSWFIGLCGLVGMTASG